jgi:hypothetical protein
MSTQSIAQTLPGSNSQVWAGRILSGIVVAFMLFDAVIHLLRIQPVVEAFARLGLPLSLSAILAIVEFICILAYALPRTSVLGAILLTGYLGGAVAIQVRAGSSLFGESLFPVYVGIVAWGGLFLRDQPLRSIFPVKR